MSVTKSTGRFVWHDCLTGDIDRAIDFFADLTQWTVRDQTTPNVGRYPIIQSPNGAIAGMLELPSFLKSSGVAPYWTGYVDTDLQRAVQQIPHLGGQLFTMPTQSAMGTSCVFADSGGAILAAYEPVDAFVVPSSTEHSEIVWQRLYCANAEKSGSFYQTLFDWRTSLSDQATTTFENSSGTTVGDIGTKPTWVEADTWVYFINVRDVSQTAARIVSNGGSLIEHTMVDNHAAIVTKDAQGGVIGFTEF